MHLHINMRWLFFSFVLLAAPVLGRPLTLKGSDTMVGLAQRWASAAIQEQPGLLIQVTGGGSGTGIAALENGSTDIAMSSRSISIQERERIKKRDGEAPEEITVARDGVSFFVNRDNPVRQITVPQLRAVFLGDITQWSEVGGPERLIVLYTRANSSGTYAYVRERLLGNEEFHPRSQPLPGTGAVVNAVSREHWGIGFGGAAFARRVVTLGIVSNGKIVQPTPRAMKNGHYPFARDLYFYLPAKPTSQAKSFVQFVLSIRAQEMAKAAGFFPLR